MKFFNPSRNRDNFINNPPRNGEPSVPPPPPVVPVVWVHTSAEWSGSPDSLFVDTSPQRVYKLSVSEGFPRHVDDNNDCSFTNKRTFPITVSGKIVIHGHQSIDSIHFVLVGSSDASGIDAPIVNDLGMVKPSTVSFTTPLTWVAEYSVVLPPGRTVFPMMYTLSGSGTISIAAMTHTIWTRPS